MMSMQKSNRKCQQEMDNSISSQLHNINTRLETIIRSNTQLTQMVMRLLKYNEEQLFPSQGQNWSRFKPIRDFQNNLYSEFSLYNSTLGQQQPPFIDQPEQPEQDDLQHSQLESFIISLNDQEPNQDYSHRREGQIRAVKNYSNQEQDYPYIRQVKVVRPQHISQKETTEALFHLRSQLPGRLQLAHPQKLLKALQTELAKMSLKFKKCECLYVYPQTSNEHFFDKITDCSNIVFLAQLKNNQIVGAFTEMGFSSKPTYIPKDNPKCCLFNLTQNHFLYASRTNKTHSCDKSYILFGNWEIKIKVGENMLYSDLGTRGDCFKKKAYGPNQPEVANTRDWIFGIEDQLKNYELARYMICALK